MSGTTKSEPLFSLIVGIDPGESGAIAGLDPYTREMSLQPFFLDDLRTTEELKLLLQPGGIRLYGLGSALPYDVYIEDPQPMPRQGANGMKTFWTRHGIIQGLCHAYGHRVNLVRPQDWKRRVFFDSPFRGKDLDKKASLKYAAQLFGKIKDRATADRSEALLIAYYGRLVSGK